MKRHSGQIVVLFFMFTLLGMAACNKPVQPTITTGMKSEISIEAKNHNANGLAFAQQGQYQKAIEEYKKAIMMEPVYTDAYVNCSKAYYSIGNYDMAQYYNLKSKEVLDSKATVIRESEPEQDEKK
ncbi:MAG: tetratricopeptide repeat protein [Pseudomonadota bacterium]